MNGVSVLGDTAVLNENAANAIHRESLCKEIQIIFLSWHYSSSPLLSQLQKAADGWPSPIARSPRKTKRRMIQQALTKSAQNYSSAEESTQCQLSMPSMHASFLFAHRHRPSSVAPFFFFTQ
ncbi:hypothetical protein TcG_07198 [Trypanosoma cruzi]|nr:hypothetical protein TcG_07198 [Trypanosoma cruzi]